MKILIVEDDPTSLLLLTATLQKLGRPVVATTNGREAWQGWQAEHFRVVISDWVMPEMDGLELCRQIRRTPCEHYTYIILLTALGGKANYLEAMSAGADDFITKPFDEDQLAARLAVVDRQSALREHTLQLEGLLPICAQCKRIRDDGDDWKPIEKYVTQHTEAKFTHSLCPECQGQYMKNLQALLPGRT